MVKLNSNSGLAREGFFDLLAATASLTERMRFEVFGRTASGFSIYS